MIVLSAAMSTLLVTLVSLLLAAAARAGPATLLTRSIAGSHAVDVASGVARQTWSSYATATGPLYADAVGDADPLPGGTVLLTYGTLRNEDGLHPDATPGPSFARLVEVDERTDEVVLDLRVHLPGTERGVRVYRAERVPDLRTLAPRRMCGSAP